MKSHQDAIAFLDAHGLIATRREWALGDTVVVALGVASQPPREGGLLVAHEHVAWMIPGTGGGWSVAQPVLMHERRQQFDTLEGACKAVLVLDELFRQFDRCPQCGGRRVVRFDERAGPARPRWFRSARCEGCGARTEEDGTDRLPADLRALELARHGSWQLWLEREPGADGWKVLRRTLSLGMPAVRELARSLPAVIHEGTLAEALSLRSELANSGVDVLLKLVPNRAT